MGFIWNRQNPQWLWSMKFVLNGLRWIDDHPRTWAEKFDHGRKIIGNFHGNGINRVCPEYIEKQNVFKWIP